jgi:hypothetical protein
MTNFIARSTVYNQLHQELLRESAQLKKLFIDDLCAYLHSAASSHYAASILPPMLPEHSITKLKIAGFIEHLRATLTAEFSLNQSAVYDRYMVDVFTDYIVVHMETESPAFTVRIWELCSRYKALYEVELSSKIPLNYQNIYLVKRNVVLTTE